MTHKYPSVGTDARTFRSRQANRKAALVGFGALLLLIAAVALFA